MMNCVWIVMGRYNNVWVEVVKWVLGGWEIKIGMGRREDGDGVKDGWMGVEREWLKVVCGVVEMIDGGLRMVREDG